MVLDGVDDIPNDLILLKFEETKMGKPIDPDLYKNYAKEIIKDRRPDKPFFEVDRPFKVDSQTVLNMKYSGYGMRYNHIPNHPDLFLGDVTRENRRGAHALPNFSEMKKFTEIRSKEKAKLMRSQDTQQNEYVPTGKKMHQLMRQNLSKVQQGMNNTYQFFNDQRLNNRANNNFTYNNPNPLKIYDYNKEINTGESQSDNFNMQYRQGFNPVNNNMQRAGQSDQIYDQQLLQSNNSALVTKDPTQIKKFTETLQTPDKSTESITQKSKTPGDIAKLYYEMKNQQMFGNSNDNSNNKASIPNADSTKINFKTGKSESFVTGPDGLVISKSNNVKAGTFTNTSQNQENSHINVGLNNINSNQSRRGQDQFQTGVNTFQSLQPKINFESVNTIVKLLQTTDNDARRKMMEDIQHSGITPFQVEPDTVRLVRNMIPVINNSMIRDNTNFTITNSGITETKGNFNSRIKFTDRQRQDINPNNYEYMKDSSTEGANKKSLTPNDSPESKVNQFETTNDDMFNSSSGISTTSKRNLHKRRPTMMAYRDDPQKSEGFVDSF